MIKTQVELKLDPQEDRRGTTMDWVGVVRQQHPPNLPTPNTHIHTPFPSPTVQPCKCSDLAQSVAGSCTLPLFSPRKVPTSLRLSSLEICLALSTAPTNTSPYYHHHSLTRKKKAKEREKETNRRDGNGHSDWKQSLVLVVLSEEVFYFLGSSEKSNK